MSHRLSTASSTSSGGSAKSFRYKQTAGTGSAGSDDERGRMRKQRTNIVLEQSEGLDLQLQEWEQTEGFRKILGNVIYSQRFDMVIGFVVILNFVTITYETDGRCTMQGNPENSDIYIETQRMMGYVAYFNLAFLLVYIMECCARLFVQHLEFFRSGWNMFDFVIVLCGVIGEIMERVVEEGGSTESMGVLRTMRMIRLLRVSRILISFQELYALISGLVNCMKTLMWAAGLVFLSLTIWSIIAVEYIHPLMADLERNGHYTLCSWCPYAFNGIMNANLTFFQIISGDGWSSLGRGLIEEHPWTAVVFVAVIFTMVFGLLNLVTAVIVDTAVRARESDHASMALQQDEEKSRLWVRFNKICKDLDKDESGCLSLQELQEGFHELPELRQFFTILGVEEEDLVKIFDIIDIDKSGLLTFEEFSGELQRLKTNHTQFTVYYIKRLAEDLHRLLTEVVVNTQAPENSGERTSQRASKRESAKGKNSRVSTVSRGTRASEGVRDSLTHAEENKPEQSKSEALSPGSPETELLISENMFANAIDPECAKQMGQAVEIFVKDELAKKGIKVKTRSPGHHSSVYRDDEADYLYGESKYPSPPSGAPSGPAPLGLRSQSLKVSAAGQGYGDKAASFPFRACCSQKVPDNPGIETVTEKQFHTQHHSDTRSSKDEPHYNFLLSVHQDSEEDENRTKAEERDREEAMTKG